MTDICFGPDLDDRVIPTPPTPQGGFLFAGPKKLLAFLESALGLTGHPNNNDYLRIEQYRQALLRHLEQCPDAFYAASFVADQFATATELLSRRDELLLAGWGFDLVPEMPERLRTLAEIEQLFHQNAEDPAARLDPGFADRMVAIMHKLSVRPHPVRHIYLNERKELLPVHFRRLVEALAKQKGTVLHNPDAGTQAAEAPPTDLGNFKKRLVAPSGKKEKMRLQKDGSL
ncbi:MAG: hypothetical protein D6714_13795, partial [Bacteroidetes bacterium]